MFCLPFPEYESDLLLELPKNSEKKDPFFVVAQPQNNIVFAQDIWFDAEKISFQSISEAALHLRSAGKYWFYYPTECVRRGKLIEDKLFKSLPTQCDFPISEKWMSCYSQAGAYTMLNENTLLFTKKRQRTVPFGLCTFKEDRENPPNRAYLKLWEALTLFGELPRADETALDLGASPGGWTYVLQQLGATVTAVDKAPLDPKIAALPNVRRLEQSAFALSPDDFSQSIDWWCSDIACYPERLYELVTKWIASGKVKRMIATIKLQGKTDFAMIQKFQALPRSQVLHLFYNKHEVTFFYH